MRLVKELKPYYKKLASLLLETPNVSFANAMKRKIESRSYTKLTIRQFISAIEWFKENYSSMHKARVYFYKGCGIQVYDINENYIGNFTVHIDEVSIHEDEMAKYIHKLEEKGVYNPDIHYYKCRIKTKKAD